MYLYDSYCYPDLDSAAKSFYSKVHIENFGILQSYSIIDSQTISFVYISNSNLQQSFEYKFLECTSTGFDNSYFGIDYTDFRWFTFQMASLLIVAYTFKNLRKNFGW